MFLQYALDSGSEGSSPCLTVPNNNQQYSGYDTLKPYPGKIILLWASEAFARSGPWRNVSEAKDVETHIFPGTHFSCKTDNLHIVVGRLKTYLNKAQEDALS